MLPSMVSNGQRKEYQVIGQGGLNLTESPSAGEFSDSRNITTKKYPVITQRAKREKILRPGTPPMEWSDPTQIWEWDGKLIVIDAGTLYYDGVEKCHVSDGEKQFAVINTKLIVWPDKIMIDLSEETALTPGQYDIMAAEIITGGDVSMSQTVILAPKVAKIATGARTVICGGGVETWQPFTWTFGTNKDAVEACWVNGAWDMAALSALAVPTHYWTYAGAQLLHVLSIGDIIIPKVSNGTYTNSIGSYQAEVTYPDNNSGVYGVLTGEGGAFDAGTGTWYNEAAITGYGNTRVGFFFDVYQSGAGTKDLTTVFSVGDWIELNNTGNADVDGVKKKISAVTSTTITVDSAYASVPTGTMSGISIKKSIPDLDYICEKGNRLWGCSNKDKTIYVSALGLPTDFYTMDGTDTDAYAVAIGSEGDFTGIYSYGGGVCCFKPDRLIKMLGDYPSEYYMNEYRIVGIQQGSNRSTIIINEVLYYKSEIGIFAYSGGVPTLISGNLGDQIYSEAVTGAIGTQLYVCMKDGSGKYSVFVYDMKTGLWAKESNEHILSFTAIKGKLYALIEDEEANYIVCYSDEGSETVKWMVEYAPNYETNSSRYSTSAILNRKDYIRFVIRVEVTGTLLMEFKTDDDNWRTAKHVSTDWTKVITVPLPPIRCDKFQLRLSGEGSVVIREIVRELTVGSKK